MFASYRIEIDGKQVPSLVSTWNHQPAFGTPEFAGGPRWHVSVMQYGKATHHDLTAVSIDISGPVSATPP
jgi:hypothetical protein